ncbi:MAG: PepSY-associated TM helix domain-containing protein, partial [Burkholderiales bacterium]
LALVVFAVAANGGLLLLRDPYFRFAYPRLARPITPQQIGKRAEILAGIETRWRTPGVEIVKFPQPGVNAFLVRLADDTQAFVDPVTGDVIDHWHWSERLPAFLFELHAHLFADRPGTIVNGMAALFVIFMTLTGVLLWWPGRRSAFRLAGAIPRRTAPVDLLRSHAAAGLLGAIPIVVFVATGGVMAFYQQTGRVMSRLFDSRAPMEANGRVAPREQNVLPWSALLPALDRTFADGHTVYYYPGTAQNARRMFRKRLPGEWHPNGRSYITIDPYTADVVQAIDARAQGAGTRFMNTIYPVHAATVGGAAMDIVGGFAALVLAWLAAGGAWSFFGRRAVRRRQRNDVGAVA